MTTPHPIQPTQFHKQQLLLRVQQYNNVKTTNQSNIQIRMCSKSKLEPSIMMPLPPPQPTTITTTTFRFQNIDEIVEHTDATVVSTLSNSVPAVYFNFDNESNKVNIMSIIKNNIFHTYKYIRSKSDLVFQTDENSLCQMILNRLNVSEDQLIRQTCWNQIRCLVPRYLNNTRTIKLSAIKKKFYGK